MTADGTGLLTLQEAADRLGVHYMTVYRRVRLGVLPARKVDGSWRIDAADLARRPTPPEPTGGPSVGRVADRSGRRRRAPWSERLRTRMLAGDSPGAWQVVEAAMASGVEPPDVYVEILAPALHAIGAGWSRGEVSIESEHLASSVAASIIGRMGPRFRRRGRHLGSVVVAMPAGERHGLGAAMVADIIALAGYEVLNLGPDTPPDSLAGAIGSRDDIRAIVVSVVDETRLPAASRLIAAARQASSSLPVLAGGHAIPDAATASRIGATAWAADPRGLPTLIGEQADR